MTLTAHRMQNKTSTTRRRLSSFLLLMCKCLVGTDGDVCSVANVFCPPSAS